MRVVILIEAFHPITGGGERQMEELAKALLTRGIDICVVTRRFSSSIKYEEISGLSVHRLSFPVPYDGKGLLWSVLKKFNLLLFLLSTLRFLVLNHNCHQIVLIQTGLSFHLSMKLPFVTSLLRVFSRRTRVVIKTWQSPWLDRTWRPHNVLRSKEERESLLASLLFQFVVDHTDRFVAITDALHRELVYEGVSRNKILEIPNGVDIRRFKPVSRLEKQMSKNLLGLSQKHIVTYVGTMKRAKGLNVLLNSWKQVSHSRPEAHLLIVGRTEPQEEFVYLSTLEQKLGIGGSVTFTGETHQVRRYLDATDVFVLPSFSEGFSNAVLEALSCGLPVVVTKIPGMGEAIVHGVNGLLVPPGDAGALAVAILGLLDDEEKAAQLGKAARKTAVESFSFDRVATGYLELFLGMQKPGAVPPDQSAHHEIIEHS